MIARLTGNPVEFFEHSFILDVQGVGYEVYATPATLQQIQTLPVATLLIYTAVREESITLFGFLSSQEKHLFTRLISVSGIGPKLALTVLGGMSTDELIRAIVQKDLARLTQISGVGKKTAERILVELKDKLVLSEQAIHPSKSFRRHSLQEDLFSALLNLGYHRSEIEKHLEGLEEHLNLEQALKSMLQRLMKRS